jgi:Plant transposon protein
VRSFDTPFLLTDGAYSRYSRFGKGNKQPINKRDKDFSAWQGAARQDIERSFALLKGCWQSTAMPILTVKHLASIHFVSLGHCSNIDHHPSSHQHAVKDKAAGYSQC